MAERAAPAQILIGMAARNHDACLVARNQEHALELRLAAFFFAKAAFEARINEVHERRVGTRSRVRPDGNWRWRTAEDRLEALLGRRSMSRRRRRLLRDVAEMWDNVALPAAIRFVQQMGLEDAAGGSSDGSLLLEAGPRYREERYRPAALPADPLAFEETHLRTCLLVMLEHLVLLERRFRPRPPLKVPRAEKLREVSAWFDELRADYDGPHAAYFKRIRLKGPGGS